MELNVQRQAITINEVVYDGYVEQPIECDALLPDYCPDIVKVLKCTVTTNVTSTQVTGDRLTIEGVAVAHVYYTSEQGGIRHAEYKVPFGKTVELRSSPSFPVVSVAPTVDYINCRAVNQRRVDIRGAISLAVKVTDAKQQEVISDASGCGMQLRREMIPSTNIVGQYEVAFTASENLEIGAGKPPVNTIIRTQACVVVEDHKAIAGKVIVKGDIQLYVCYQSMDDENSLEVMEYSIPVSQIISTDGADEDCVCDVNIRLVSCDISPRQDSDGEYRVLAFDAKLVASAICYRNQEVAVVSDCYSTQYDCKRKERESTFTRLNDIVNDRTQHKTSLELPEGLKYVLDAWCDSGAVSWKQKESKIDVTVPITICMFAQMEDGETVYFEQQSDVTHEIPARDTDRNLTFTPGADVLSCAYNMAEQDSIDIRCDVLIFGSIFCEERHSSLVDITVDEESPKPKVENKLFIYYADKGESIWDIAKRYNTSAGAIWEENSAAQDILPENAMLMIPIV